MWNIDLMFGNGLVHGDLSAHNILYWDGKATIIDFPQAVVPFVNPHAYEFLVRDVKRVCEYFSRYGIESDHDALTKEIWDRYVPS
jgi:RIO kinase 1